HHAQRRVARVEEGADDLEALHGTHLLGALAGPHDLAQLLGLALEVEGLQTLLDRLRAHVALEVVAEAVAHLAVQLLVALEVLDLQGAEAVEHRVEAVDLLVEALADLRHLALGSIPRLLLDVGLGLRLLELGEILFELLLALVDLVVAAVLQLLLGHADLRLEARQVAVTRLLVDAGHHVGREVDDLVEVLRRDVQQQAQPARHTLEVPDVRDRRGELDVAHALTPHLAAGHLDATALTDDALVADSLVLAAVALPVPGRAEDLLAEESVPLGLERAVVDGLGLLDLAVRPGPDVFTGGQADAQFVEEVHVQHVVVLCCLVGGLVGLCDVVLRPLRHCSAHAATDRYPAPRLHGSTRRRSPSCRWRSRLRPAPRRSGTTTASP